ncbi:hypothetical protein GCM10027299_21340 [Larkinella ripae]
MTSQTPPLPLAAIFAYYGTKATCESLIEGEWKQVALDSSYNWGYAMYTLIMMPEYIRNFQLHLRPLSSITEDDLRQVARLAGIREEVDIHRTMDGYRMRRDNYDFILEFDRIGDLKAGMTLMWQGQMAALFNPAPVVDYLRGQGYFWPSKALEGFVKLVNE